MVLGFGAQSTNRKFNSTDEDGWRRLLEVNTIAVIRCIKLLLDIQHEDNFCRVVVISSVAGMRPSVKAGAIYSASKHAVNGFVKTLAEEFESKPLRFSLVSPGATNTKMLDTREVPLSSQEKSKLLQPSDVAETVYFLANLSERVQLTEIVLEPSV